MTIENRQFQSTLPHGSDFDLAAHCRCEELFQSTLPYGSDAKPVLLYSRTSDFNPRSLTGATIAATARNTILLFQSTLPYGSDIVLLQI